MHIQKAGFSTGKIRYLVANVHINFWAGTSCLAGLTMADIERGHQELSETPLTFCLRPIAKPPRAAQKMGTL